MQNHHRLGKCTLKSLRPGLKRLVCFIQIVNGRTRTFCTGFPRSLHTRVVLPFVSVRPRDRVNFRHVRTLLLGFVNARLISRASTPTFLPRVRRSAPIFFFSLHRNDNRLLTTIAARETGYVSYRTFQISTTRGVLSVTGIAFCRYGIVLSIRTTRGAVDSRNTVLNKRIRYHRLVSRFVIALTMLLWVASNSRFSLRALYRLYRFDNTRRHTVLPRSLTTRTTFFRPYRATRIGNYFHIAITLRRAILFYRGKRRVTQSTRVFYFYIIIRADRHHGKALYNEGTHEDEGIISKRHGYHFVIINIVLRRLQGLRLLSRDLKRQRASRAFTINHRGISIFNNNGFNDASRIPLIFAIKIVHCRGSFSLLRILRDFKGNVRIRHGLSLGTTTRRRFFYRHILLQYF